MLLCLLVWRKNSFLYWIHDIHDLLHFRPAGLIAIHVYLLGIPFCILSGFTPEFKWKHSCLFSMARSGTILTLSGPYFVRKYFSFSMVELGSLIGLLVISPSKHFWRFHIQHRTLEYCIPVCLYFNVFQSTFVKNVSLTE